MATMYFFDDTGDADASNARNWLTESDLFLMGLAGTPSELPAPHRLYPRRNFLWLGWLAVAIIAFCEYYLCFVNP